ncbi:MAG TPA: TAT-variant-translocated molybdopterin oxidoreductase [Azospirillum sp.]
MADGRETWEDAHGPRFWRSLEQLAASPEAMRLVEREFPHLGEAARTDRRTLLKLLGASLVLAGLTACDDAPARPRPRPSTPWQTRCWSACPRRAGIGVIPGTAYPPLAVQAAAPPPPPPSAGDGVTVAFAPDPAVWDGRFANNAWLQELPRPLTKQVWGNAVLLAPVTAARLGVADGDVVEVTVAGRSVAGPACVLPGHAADAVTLPLGYGRWRAGFVGDHVGFSAYAVRRSDSPWFDRADLRPTGARLPLVTTQDHHTLAGRDVVRAATLATFRENPEFARGPAGPFPSFYPEYRYEGHAWGMAIDLNACTGCNACVVACQAENNVPVVGPKEVARHRQIDGT